MQFRVLVVTDPHTSTPTNARRPPIANPQTGPITIHCTAKFSVQCNHVIPHYLNVSSEVHDVGCCEHQNKDFAGLSLWIISVHHHIKRYTGKFLGTREDQEDQALYWQVPGYKRGPGGSSVILASSWVQERTRRIKNKLESK